VTGSAPIDHSREPPSRCHVQRARNERIIANGIVHISRVQNSFGLARRCIMGQLQPFSAELLAF
jgi:hypothetical protein